MGPQQLVVHSIRSHGTKPLKLLLHATKCVLIQQHLATIGNVTYDCMQHQKQQKDTLFH